MARMKRGDYHELKNYMRGLSSGKNKLDIDKVYQYEYESCRYNGWKNVCGHSVFVEDGKVMTTDAGIPYRKHYRTGEWENLSGKISPESLRYAIRNNRIEFREE